MCVSGPSGSCEGRCFTVPQPDSWMLDSLSCCPLTSFPITYLRLKRKKKITRWSFQPEQTSSAVASHISEKVQAFKTKGLDKVPLLLRPGAPLLSPQSRIPCASACELQPFLSDSAFLSRPRCRSGPFL